MKTANKRKRLEARIKDYENTLKRIETSQVRGWHKPSSMKH
jgi:hypothetical protein